MSNEARPFIITTEHRGVFCGLVPTSEADRLGALLTDDNGVAVANKTIRGVTDARMAIYWTSEVNGVMGLASKGPLPGCRIGAPADIEVLTDVTALFRVTPEAWDRWVEAS